MKHSGLLLILACLTTLTTLAQAQKTGPVIADFGPSWDIPNATYGTDTSKTFKVVFDVMNSPEDQKQVNPWMETAARFLNMHARNGVPPEQMKVALVVHNKASTDLLKDDAYRARFGVPNPNSGMLKQLMDAGVDVIFCGQSSMARHVPIETTVEGTQLALSAMTALLQLQDQGYRLIKF